MVEAHAKPILDSYVARLRDGEVSAADLVVSKRLTQYPEEYAHATHSAIAAQSLQARGIRLRPGETVEYVICDARATVPGERVRPVELDGPMTYDSQEYERLLRGALRPFVPRL